MAETQKNKNNVPQKTFRKSPALSPSSRRWSPPTPPRPSRSPPAPGWTCQTAPESICLQTYQSAKSFAAIAAQVCALERPRSQPGWLAFTTVNTETLRCAVRETDQGFCQVVHSVRMENPEENPDWSISLSSFQRMAGDFSSPFSLPSLPRFLLPPSFPAFPCLPSDDPCLQIGRSRANERAK